MKTSILAVLVCVMGTVRAQELLTLDVAVSTALELNHQLRGASHDRDAAWWGKRNAMTHFLPKVEFSSSITRIDPESERRANAAVDFIRNVGPALGIPPSALTDIRPFAYRDAYATGLTVVQPIYNGGGEIVGLQAADAMQDKAEFSYQDTEQEIMAGVKAAYFTVLKSEELLALANESAERTRRWLEMTRRREALGSRTRTDVLRFEVQLASDEGNIVNARNGLALARLQLNEIMGVDLGRTYILEKPPVPGESPSAVVSSQSLQMDSQGTPAAQRVIDQSFLATHPAMRTAEANLRLAESWVDQSWVNFKPRINVAFQYGWEQNNTLNLDGIRPWALSLSLRWPIFNSFGDYTSLQKSKAEYASAERGVERYRRGLLLQATHAQLTVTAALKRIEIAKKALEQGEEVLNSVTRRYDAGAASNVELIDAQTAYASAKTDYITSMYDHYISEVQLARATGIIHR